MSELAPEGAPVELPPEQEDVGFPAEPAEAPWMPSQEEWQQQQQALQYLLQLVNPQEQQQQQPEIDPFDRQQLTELARQEARAVLDEEARNAAADEQAWELIDQLAANEGAFLFEGSRERARELAEKYVHQTQAQYGVSPKAATEALQLAYRQVREEETKIGDAYHQQQLAQLQGLGAARREPAPSGQTGASSQLISVNGPGDETAVLHKYFRG